MPPLPPLPLPLPAELVPPEAGGDAPLMLLILTPEGSEPALFELAEDPEEAELMVLQVLSEGPPDVPAYRPAALRVPAGSGRRTALVLVSTLACVVLVLLVVFVRELIYYVPQAFAPGHGMSSNDVILAVLSLVDLSLAGNLLLIVMFSGYENFVSKLDLDGETDRPPWMGTVDFSGLKMKLIASIVAISAIDLLKRFMELGRPGSEPLADRELAWLVTIHVVFVVSGLLLAAMDWLIARSGKKYGGP